MNLSTEERAILAHALVNEDPEEWAKNALLVVGQWAIDEKIERWRQSYENAKDEPGYKTARQHEQQRQRDDEAATRADVKAARDARKAARTADDQHIKDLVATEVARILQQ